RGDLPLAVVSHRDKSLAQRGCLSLRRPSRTRNSLAIDEPVVAFALDIAAPILGLDCEKTVGARHNMVDLDLAFGKYDIAHDDIILRQIAQCFYNAPTGARIIPRLPHRFVLLLVA